MKKPSKKTENKEQMGSAVTPPRSQPHVFPLPVWGDDGEIKLVPPTFEAGKFVYGNKKNTSNKK